MQPQRTAEPSDEASPSPAQASVLVVDDHLANLESLAAVLEPLAVRVVTARSGVEALRAALAEDFAVILMDVHMPGLNGLETAAQIRGRPRSRRTPIIFVSASPRDASLIARGYAQGAVDYLVKPYEPEILRSKVAVFVDLHLQAEQIRRQEALLRIHEREALHRAEEHRFRSLLDALPLSTWALGTDGVISYSSRRWLDFSGRAPQAGAPVWELEALHPDDRGKLSAAWAEALASGQPFALGCRFRRASDDADRWHLLRAVPERDAEDSISGWVMAAIDVDDQRRAAEARLETEQEARSRAEETNRLKDQFLAVVSHELRTPLTGILGWTRVLRVTKRGAVHPARAVEAIERNARAQARLVDDLLDVTRMATGKLSVNVRPVGLQAVLSAALDAVRPTAEAKGVVLEVEVGAGDVVLLADPERLQQVCWNLLVNAVKFTPGGGRVAVRLHAREDAVELVVQDDGQGIDPAFLPHLFEPFRQADMSLTRAHGGAGLGLALVRHLVELHGGTVRADSAGRGKGTTFSVVLPKRPPLATEHEAVDHAPHRGAATLGGARLLGVRVLVVDDDDDARALFTAILENRGAEVRAAASARDALATLREAPSDVLLSDLAMPQEDGYSLLRRLRALDGDQGGAIPAAAITAFVDGEVGERARTAGFQAHLVKPIEPAQLTTLVAALARRARAG